MTDTIKIVPRQRGGTYTAWSWGVKVNGVEIGQFFRWHSGPYQIKLGGKVYRTKLTDHDDIAAAMVRKLRNG